MKKIILILFFHVLLIANNTLLLNIENKKYLTFEEVFREALSNNYDIKNIRKQKKIFNEDINYEKLGYLPRVDFSYNINQLNKDEERNESKYKYYKNTFSISSNLNLYDFGARSTKIALIKKEIKIKDLELCDLKIKLALKLLDLYVEIYKSRDLMRMLSKSLSMNYKKYYMKKKLYKEGFIGSLELINDKNVIIKIKNKINEEKNKINYYISLFNEETGILLFDNIILKPITEYNNFSKKDLIINNIQTKINEEKIKKKYTEIIYLKKQNMPTLEFYYNNYFYNGSNDNFHIREDYNHRDYSLGFNFKWSLNSFFNYEYQKRKKYIELEINKISYSKYKREFRNNFNSKNLLIQNFDNYKSIKTESINNLKKEIKVYERLYVQGLDYKYKEIESKIKLLSEDYDLKIKEIDNNKNKKYISLLLEKENVCTRL